MSQNSSNHPKPKKSRLTIFLRTLIVVLGLMAFTFLGICYYFTSLIIHPPQQDIEDTKARIARNWGKTYEEYIAQLTEPEGFSISSSTDGINLQGWYMQQSDSSECAVVLAHGWGNTRASMLKYAPIFWDCGCDLIFYDHRGHSESGGDFATGGVLEKQDLLDITQWVQKKTGFSDNQIGWAGASWGAATALQAGAEGKKVAFIMADSPYQDWYSAIFERAERRYGDWTHYISMPIVWMVDMRTGESLLDASPLKAAEHIQSPVLLIHSQTDRATASTQSVNIASRLPALSSDFHHTDWGAGHTGDVLKDPDAFRKLVYDFLDKKAPGFAVWDRETEEEKPQIVF